MAILPLLGQYFIWFPQAAGFERQWNQVFGIESPLGIVPLLLEIVPILAYVVLMSRAFRTIGPRLVITANEQGVAWHVQGRRPREHRASWSAVRAFVRTTYASPYGVGAGGTAYLLDCGDTALTWTLTAGSKDDEYLDSETLSRLIATRTRLPLRDLSEAVAELSLAYTYAAGFSRRRPLDRDPDPRWVALFTPALAPFNRGMQILAGAFLVPLLFLLLAGSLGWFIQQLPTPH